MGLKNSNQHLSEDNRKLREEKKTIEAKFEAFKSEVDKMNEVRMQDRLKIDSLIAFCNLIENCRFDKDEMGEQLSELPNLIPNYLNGISPTLVFK
mgnify:FL=1